MSLGGSMALSKLPEGNLSVMPTSRVVKQQELIISSHLKCVSAMKAQTRILVQNCTVQWCESGAQHQTIWKHHHGNISKLLSESSSPKLTFLFSATDLGIDLWESADEDTLCPEVIPVTELEGHFAWAPLRYQGHDLRVTFSLDHVSDIGILVIHCS